MSIERYLLSQFSTIFFPLFFTLIFVASIVLFVKISSLTSLISVTFPELFFLFFYSLPSVLFFVLPLSLFVSFVLILNRLSHEFELPVLFSLGLKPSKIIASYLKLAIVTTLISLLISLLLVPLSFSVYERFLEVKKDSSAINIRTSEIGQKFGDWLVYINSKEKDMLEGVVLFSNRAFEEESLIYATSAKISTDSDSVGLELKKGFVLIDKEEYLDEVLFEDMVITNSLGGDKDRFRGVIEHWAKGFGGDTKRAKEFAQALLVSFFPIVAIYFVLAFGLVNPRSRGVYVYIAIGGFIGLYYGGLYFVSITYPFLGSLLFGIVLFFAGVGVYKTVPSRLY